MRVLRTLLKKEFLQIRRDGLMMRQLFLMPIVQLVILSSAATFEVKRATMYVVDRDHTTMSTGLVDRLRASGRFVPVGASPSMDQANEAMLARRAGVIVSIPADFEKDLVTRQAAQVQLVLNAEDGAAAGVTLSYAQQIIAAYSREIGTAIIVANSNTVAGRQEAALIAARQDAVPSSFRQDAVPSSSRQEETPSSSRQEETPSSSGQQAPPTAFRQPAAIDIRARGWYNPELNYRDYMVPGILVQLVTVIGTLLTAMNIVREKEIGTLDQLSVTPLGRGTFIAAKLIPLWIIALVELSLGLAVGRFLFDVPLVGSLGLVFVAAAIYLLAALGTGLLISTVVDTQQQAMFITFFLVMIYLLMSGLFTPVRSMPGWAQWIAAANPVKHIIDVMRAVMLKGARLTDLLAPLAYLASFGAVMLLLAVRQYGRRVG